jgi:hypothetical protein
LLLSTSNIGTICLSFYRFYKSQLILKICHSRIASSEELVYHSLINTTLQNLFEWITFADDFNFFFCLILYQLCTYKMLNRIVNSNNNFCIVCLSNIYQSSITLINISKFHKNSTSIPPNLFTLKTIYHHISPPSCYSLMECLPLKGKRTNRL